MAVRDGTVTLRSAEPSDAANLLMIAREVMAEQIYTLTDTAEFTFTVAEEERWIEELRDDPSSLLLLAIRDGTLVASLDLTPGQRARISHTAEIAMMVVAEFRVAGIGKALLAGAIEWTAAHPKLEKLNLKVHANNDRAIGLYRLLGFREEGRQVRDIRYGPDHYVDTILMAHFVKSAK